MADRRTLLTWVIVLTLTHHINAQGWVSPHFLDAQTEGIELKYINQNVPYALDMEEEIPWDPPFRLVNINYRGTGTPVVDFFLFGSAQFLSLTILKTADQWSIYVNNRQDYENLSQQQYIVRIRIQDDTTATNTAELNINTLNIFDNNPTITYEGPCHARELEANQVTDCTFKVYHPDGILNNPFRLVIEGSNNEQDLFSFSDPVDLADAFNREYKLIVVEELRFERRAMYSFRTHIFDVVNHTSSITTIVQIEDIPSLPPAWIKPFATARFNEKTDQTFDVEAIDGDTDINKRIEYRVTFFEGEDYSAYIEIDRMTGIISINAIDRDLLKQEVFPFRVVAYKFDNITWDVVSDAVIIVDDINDHMPEVTVSPNVIAFKEATYLTLPLDKFIVNDIDLGRNAQYYVALESADTQHNYIQPFMVIPNKGYQESNFTITISDTTFLDYEVEAWQTFTVTIVATEEDNAEQVGQFDLQIELINWNDELPIFDQESYTISVEETVPANTFLIHIDATDRDIGDKVIHSIVGRTDLLITPDGEISTKSDDTFDYERQSSVLVQIMATDTLQTFEGEKLHTVYTQLLIEVIDINDKTPEMRMPRVSPRLMENSVGETIVTPDGIIATDPDGTADLFFTIDWTASYATKSGQEADQYLYENCFYIEADKTDRNRVIGYLKVNPEFKLQIDYEEYEVIYLSITVTDHNQVVNDNSTEGVITIRIDDENDNKPLFILDTLETSRSVVENATEGTIIGTIFANDIDGPFFNVITYSISPFEGTPDGLVEINPTNGVITVKADANIDCDDPRIDDLIYTVSLNDTLWVTSGEIRVHIIDINNKSPTFGIFALEVYKYENITNGTNIEHIITFDKDRDDPHRIVLHLINFKTFPRLDNFFQIDPLSGQIKARLQGDTVFDRDRGEKEHDIYVDIEDNYLGNGRKNYDSTMVKLVLLDVNDNAPQMPSPLSMFQQSVSENSLPGLLLGVIDAIDIDDETTPNAQVGYGLLGVVPGTNTPSPLPDDYEHLFAIDAVTGEVRLTQSPKGYYGTWMVTIEAYDHGHNWDSHIQLRSQETYEITLDPYNFNAPTIINPTDGRTHRLSFAGQQIGRPLVLTDGAILPYLEASDEDGGIYGDVTFEMADYETGSGDSKYFDIIKIDTKRSQIYLMAPIEPKFYKINIRAEDGGGRQSDWATNITFFFVDLTGEPVFEMSTFHTDFTENITGLEEYRIIPEAQDPKNVGIDDVTLLIDVFYFIDANYRPDDAVLFELDPVSRYVTLRNQLDRESVDNHEFRVIATNRRDGPQSIRDGSYLVVHVSVNDVNDNPPTFEYRSYGSGITVTDQIGKAVLTVKATDPDLDDVIRYVIKQDTLVANGENLAEVLSTAFLLNSETGVLTLNFGVLPIMKGYIEFQVQAFDLVDHEDTCDVKIFIISESNRVTFVFLNDKETVDEHRERVGLILSNYYKYECNIDDISKAEQNGVAQEHTTNVRAHFIQNNEAVESAAILARSNDVAFITTLRAALQIETIILLDIPNTVTASDDNNMEAILQILLIVITLVLGLTLIGVIGMYVMRVRSLNRQLRAMSTSCDNGDIISKPNRMELPTSNEFSKAGSNPVLNNNSMQKNQMFDTLSLNSESSDDQDFVGIDNDPTFVPTGKITGANLAVINGLNKRVSPTLNDIAEENGRYSDVGVHRF